MPVDQLGKGEVSGCLKGNELHNRLYFRPQIDKDKGKGYTTYSDGIHLGDLHDDTDACCKETKGEKGKRREKREKRKEKSGKKVILD